MANPIFRFTLSHAIAGSLQISEPDGWKDAVLKLERHSEFKTLVEYFDGAFIFYGNNGRIDGGVGFIRTIERDYGFDATLIITIETSFNSGTTYTTIFTGQLDLALLEELENNKIKVPIIRNDFWSKFISRLDSPVNIQSTTDLDDGSITQSDSVYLTLTPQKVLQRVSMSVDKYTLYGTQSSRPLTNDYLQVDWDNVLLSEITTKFNYPVDFNTELPFGQYTMEYDGEYQFLIKLYFTQAGFIVSAGPPATWEFTEYADLSQPTNRLDMLFLVNNDPISDVFSRTDHIIDASNGYTEYNFSATLQLKKGDTITITGSVISGGFWPILLGPDTDGLTQELSEIDTEGTLIPDFPAGYVSDNIFTINGNTVFYSTRSEAFLLHDVAGAVCDRIIGQENTFYSDFLGSTLTNYRTYGSNGCGWPYILIRGLQLRQYYLTDKPFSISFNQLWKGVNPILNLSLGYDIVSGNEVIRIENLENAYDTTISTYISYIKNISRSYDNDLIFNKVEVGYGKWQSEEASGIDDVQTKHTYTTILKKSGKVITILSDFIAASLAIETTRRTTKEKSADYKFDNETFIIKINPDDTSPDAYVPELDENFSSITNLLNSDTRYNSQITPARNLLRWVNFINGCLQSYLTSVYKFVSGEGNYDMTSTLNAGSCDEYTTNLSEKQDIQVTTDFIHLPIAFQIEIDMSWSTYDSIRNNRNKAIGISQTNANYVTFYIKSLEYQICKSRAKIIGWPKELLNITNTPWIAPNVNCDP